MRAWTKVWIAVAAVCIAATIYETPNAVRIARFSWLIKKDRHTPSGDPNVQVIVPEQLVATDPEVGDMLRYCLTYSPFSYENPNLEELVALVEKWPQNEFFLSQLAEELTGESAVDPQAALVVVDRLLKLNGQNAHYRFLRGWIFLTDPNRPDRLQEALEQFELGHNLPEFYQPYNKYKQRMDRLRKKSAIIWEQPGFSSFYMKFAKYLFRTSGLPDKLSGDALRHLTVSVGKMADRVIKNADDRETLLACIILLGAPEEIRLKKLDMSETEAQESRFRLARSVALLDVFRQSSFFEIYPFVNTILIGSLAVYLFVSVCYSVLGRPLGLVFGRLHKGEPKECNNIKPWLLSDGVLSAILALLVVLESTKKRPEGELPLWIVFLAVIFIPWSAVVLHVVHPVNIARLRRPRLCLAALCSSLWFKGAVFWNAGSLNASTPDLVRYALVLLGWSVLCVLIWAEVAYQTDLFKAKHCGAVASIIQWVVILMVIGVFGPFYVQMERSFGDDLSQYGPLPQATQETYNRAILGQGLSTESSMDPMEASIPKYFGFAASKDVGRVIAERRALGRPISDTRLRGILRNCGRDAQPILLGALEDPNAFEVLVIRAKWGDGSVKEQLERIFQQRLATFRESAPEPRPGDPSSLGGLLELAGTLARISDGPEAQERFSYLMEQVVARTRSFGTEPALGDPRYTDRVIRPFWKALGELPPAQAAALIKSYLRQTQFVDLSADRGGAITLLAGLLADGDRELAEEVVGALAALPSAVEPVDAPYRETEQQRTFRLTRHRDGNSPQCLDAIFAHLGVESIQLLRGHLDSDNDQLRAFIVWRVTSLGYKWPREQLAALRKDRFWKVRVNALFARDANGLPPVHEDKSALVRLIAQMLKSEPK